MHINRRHFIRSASVIAALSFRDIAALSAAPLAKEQSKFGAFHDETYWESVRQAFPLRKELAYLNNGTFGPSPYPVIEAVQEAMMEADHGGSYGNYDLTVVKLAKFVGVEDEEITLTHNVTEGINIACWGVPLKKGDEVILTTHEHSGNAIPWMSRMKLDGVAIRTFHPAATAAETLERIKALINHKTRVIAVPHILCTQGQVLPVKDICAFAREREIYSLIDGAHGAGMMPLDLHDLGCDTYATCAHKWMLGPKGTGFLYIRKEFREMVRPHFGGAGTDDGKWDLVTSPITISNFAPNGHRYLAGTQNNALYSGVNAAVDFLASIGIENIYERIKSLGKYTQDRLLEFGDKVELITPTEDQSRCAINGFRIKNVEISKFFELCMNNKVRIRSVTECGLNSLRASTHIYNTHEEIDRLMELIKKSV